MQRLMVPSVPGMDPGGTAFVQAVFTCEQVHTRAVTADKRCMDSLLVCFEG